MRVIAGRLGGRRLRAPGGRGTRPTSDRVREALFSSLGWEVVDAHVLDLYAGSGALGIEALSRGAASAVFVERARPALRVLQANLRALGIDAAVVGAEVAQAATPVIRAARGPFGLVFADPPYGAPLDELVDLLARLRDEGLLAAGARVVVERDRRAEDAHPAWLDLERRRTYGDTSLVFLRASG